MLSTEQQKKLKSRAHALKPVVTVAGKGLTENVLAELNIALNVHELIKVKVVGYDRKDKEQIMTQMAEKTTAQVIQTIGHVVVLWRKQRD